MVDRIADDVEERLLECTSDPPVQHFLAAISGHLDLLVEGVCKGTTVPREALQHRPQWAHLLAQQALQQTLGDPLHPSLTGFELHSDMIGRAGNNEMYGVIRQFAHFPGIFEEHTGDIALR